MITREQVDTLNRSLDVELGNESGVGLTHGICFICHFLHQLGYPSVADRLDKLRIKYEARNYYHRLPTPEDYDTHSYLNFPSSHEVSHEVSHENRHP